MRPLSLVAFVEQPAETTEYKLSIHGRLTHLRKQPQEKQTGELLATKHAHMYSLMMYPLNGGEICVLKWCAYKIPLANLVTIKGVSYKSQESVQNAVIINSWLGLSKYN